jgi:hypothetical protein
MVISLVACAVELAQASGGGEHGGPPGGPPPTELGPPRLIGDYHPYPFRYQKYNSLVSGSKSASKSRWKPVETPVEVKVPATARPQFRELECVVPSSLDMVHALQSCMTEAGK